MEGNKLFKLWAKEQHTAIIENSGTFFGYPSCCISAFSKNINRGIKPSKLRYLAGNQNGFVPCAKHAKMILQKKIKIEDLIHSRQCHKPFPQGHPKDFRKFLNKT
jgi:hypothetical protein